MHCAKTRSELLDYMREHSIMPTLLLFLFYACLMVLMACAHLAKLLQSFYHSLQSVFLADPEYPQRLGS